mmetsp:Transcript_122304/g.182773  ORF Transcript_122304/g.182773 Transcript_122304/m.182773 type:complete len:442 (+) Transcript_122304:30-1355(+)
MTALPPTIDPEELEAASRVITRKQILQQRVEWAKLSAAGIISQEEVRLMNLYDAKSIERKVAEFRENPAAYASLFMNVIGGNKGVASLERTRYGLSLMEEILEEEPSCYPYFLQTSDPWSPLLTIMDTKSDDYCASKAAKLISLFLFRSKQMPQNVLDEVLVWCNDHLRKPTTAPMALEGLENLLRHDDVRVRFFEDDGLNRLALLIKDPKMETQIIYKVLLCLWLLSYNDNIASQFHHETNVISNIISIIKAVPKEKIIRIGTAILANIANKGQNNQIMIEGKIARFLETANQRKWADPDLLRDLEFLTETITDVISEMSSWEAYKTEVSSGTLEKSPVHYSDRFWKENMKMFEKDKFEVLGMLIHILKESQNAQNLEIACHDVGQFIRYHPLGRQIINQMDGKYIIMGLMEHQNAAVQKESLLCTQKLLVVSWEHLGSK